MTDKEQKKWHKEKWGENEEPEETPTERPHCDDDSIKNQDKEQIMINGVDVSGCKHFPSLIYKDYPEWAVCHVYGAKKCEERCDCYFKQLVRKTQECEELRKELNGSEKWRINAESLNEKLDIKNTRYREALEEIEGYVRDNSDFDKSDILTSKTGAYDILDIINKAKGEE